jgi:hypothetical protein
VSKPELTHLFGKLNHHLNRRLRMFTLIPFCYTGLGGTWLIL